MAKRNLPHKLNCKRARQKRESKREEQETKLERARQAKFAKKTVQQQQIGHEEGEVETEQQEMDQAEQVEVVPGIQRVPCAVSSKIAFLLNLRIFRNILRGGGPMHVTEFLPQSPRRDNILVALELLAKLQSFAVADLLSADQIADFRATADQFRVHMLEHFHRHCSTSKFHHLVHHAPEFAENHGFWGLLSEQPVEKFHALFNDDLARKANTKDLHDILMFCARESAIRNAIFDSNEL
ncbi:hypothetical protein niasHT_020268 [Heterodera trifolii]|uniref:Uncharacterized protein n=1 Tax=Heterodera trifolii TaxID=157864 RepID=A0ABD2KSF5_9BILA